MSNFSAPAAARYCVRPQSALPAAPERGARRRAKCQNEFIRVFETYGTGLLLPLHPREIYHAWRCRCTSCSSRTPRMPPRAQCQLPMLYERYAVSWLKKAQTSCVDLFSIGSKQKCIDFCKYASYLPAKLEAGACSPLSAPAAVVGRQLQHRGQCSQQCDHRRRDQRSWSKPKSRRRQRRPRLAAPPYS